MPETTFEGFAIVEILGHQRVAGYVTTEAFGSVVMFKVAQSELPATETVLKDSQYVDGEYCPAGSKVRISRERAETFVGAASVYRMTPCTEEQATKAQPCKVEILEKAQRALTAGVPLDAFEEGFAPDEPADDEMDRDIEEALAATAPEVEPMPAACAACAALGPGGTCPDCIPF